MTSILVVEDDAAISAALVTSLRAQGHRVEAERSGRAALRQVDDRAFDLILLDLGLPDLDGVEVCRQLRAIHPGCVLVILTARTDEIDVVMGLEAGADDYLTKPFRMAELLARVRAHLRRGAGSTSDPTLTVGALVIDTAARRVTIGGAEVVLRAKEFDLVARLAVAPGVAVRRETLMADVWDAHWFGSTKTLDVHVALLRRKLLEAATAAGVPAPRIGTLRGHGYRLESGS